MTLTILYTDGACLGNPGPGGWAWLEVGAGFDSGGEPSTTNQRMELTAALRGIQAVKGDLTLRSDSQYLVRCFNEGWWRRWRQNSFKNSKNQPVANRDLWEQLLSEVVDSGRKVEFVWVKGHSDDEMNARVDRLAQEAARSFR